MFCRLSSHISHRLFWLGVLLGRRTLSMFQDLVNNSAPSGSTRGLPPTDIVGHREKHPGTVRPKQRSDCPRFQKDGARTFVPLQLRQLLCKLRSSIKRGRAVSAPATEPVRPRCYPSKEGIRPSRGHKPTFSSFLENFEGIFLPEEARCLHTVIRS